MDDQLDPYSNSDQNVDPPAMAQQAFDSFDISHMRHMSMPEVPLRRQSSFNMSPAQQNTMPHLISAQSYSGAGFSPMQEHPSNTTDQELPAQFYDPQLGAMDRTAIQGDLTTDNFGPATGGSNLEDSYPGMLQFWLSQADSDFGYTSVDIPNFSTSPFGGYGMPSSDLTQPLNRAFAPSETSEATTTSNVPHERFAKVERAWAANTGRPIRLVPSLWHDIAEAPGPNLFSQVQPLANSSDNIKSESRWGIDAALKQRLETEFGTSSSSFPGSAKDNSFPRPSNLAFPPPEVLDICLDVYFRRFHPMAPFVHMPTFSAASAPLPLLYAMCILGLSAMKSSGGGNFIKHAFTNLLRRSTSDLALDAVTLSPPSKRLAIFAAGFLTLNVASLSGVGGITQHLCTRC